MSVQIAVPSPIRKVNVRHDLLAIADLIEICFASTLDEDGRDYLSHLRWAARDLNYLSWLQGAAERLTSPLYGFVWEERGRIVGNLSLIPLFRRGKLYYLIANVAVHPEYRRRGIGRKLTEAAIIHLRERAVKQAWLQVRDDNPGAIQLYESLGFVERARRTSWLCSAPTTPLYRHTVPGISIHYRRGQDWDRQLAWLRLNYPPEVAWNLPIHFPRLSPRPWHRLMRFLRGEVQEHWAARRNGTLMGVLSWEPMRGSSDMLWLASTAAHEEQAISTLLPYARQVLSRRRRTLTLNYPAGRAGDAFLRAGFAHHQTLIWMSINV